MPSPVEPAAVEEEPRSALDATVLRLEELLREAHGFVETVAHDLRAPLAAMSGFAELVAKDESLPVVAQQLLRRIVISSHTAADRVESVLQQARVRTGELHEEVLRAYAVGLEQLLAAVGGPGPLDLITRRTESGACEVRLERPDGHAVTFTLPTGT